MVADGSNGISRGRRINVANWPWTLIGMMPINKALMATELEDAGTNSRTLIIKWSKLHAVRTLLGVLAVLAFLIALGHSDRSADNYYSEVLNHS
jgi:Domain of unknown function (DUF1772)